MHNSKERGTYIEFLQASIISECDALEQRTPQIFIYRGEYLRPAIEKKLYFQLVSSEASQKNFDQKGKIELNKNAHNFIWHLLKHWFRIIRRSLYIKEVNPTRKVKYIGLAFTAKHAKFLNELIDTGTFRILSFTDFIRLQKASIPKRNESSKYLFFHHYDLLVQFESIKSLIQDKKHIILAEGNSALDCLTSICAKKLNIQSTCIQYGWAFTVHLGFRSMMHQQFLSWGGGFSEILKPFNPDTNFINTGHPLLNPKPNASRKKNISVILQAPVRWIGEDTFEEFMNLVQLLAKSGKNLLLREHPSWPLDQCITEKIYQFENVTKIENQLISLESQLSESIIALTIYSSVGFESIVQGCIPIFFQPFMNIEMHPSLQSEKSQFVFLDSNSAFTTINDLLNKPSEFDQVNEILIKLKNSYFEASGDQAKKKIKSILNPLID